MTRTIFTRTFWFDAAERATKTAAQAVILAFGQDAAGVDLFAADLGNLAGTALAGAVISVLTSIVSAPIGGNGTASVVTAPPGPVATEV